MIISRHTKQWILEGISFLFILLFMYAAVSKLGDFEQFRTQLNQSPYINRFAGFLAWFIPGLEILISILFFFPRLKLEGLYASFSLMFIFTVYLVAVLNFADTIPCSCGGVIASLSWNEHLVFNLTFILLAGLGIILWKNEKNDKILIMLLELQKIKSFCCNKSRVSRKPEKE